MRPGDGQLSLFEVDAAGRPQSFSAEPAPPRDHIRVDEAVQAAATKAAGNTPEAEGTRASRRGASPVSGSLLSPEDVARQCGLSRKAVYRAVARGELRAARILSRLRIDPCDVEAWIRANVVDAEGPVPAPVPPRLSASTGLRRLLPEP